MGRDSLFTEAEVFAKADELVALGIPVSALSLWRALGSRGSMSTMQGHSDNWNARKADERELNIPDMPDAVILEFNSVWLLAHKEANKTAQKVVSQCSALIESSQKEADEYRNFAVGVERENGQLKDEIDCFKADKVTGITQIKQLEQDFEQTRALLMKTQLAEQEAREANANLMGQIKRLESDVDRCETRFREQESLLNAARDELASLKAKQTQSPVTLRTSK